MGDRRGDEGMRQQPPFSSGHQERVFDGGGPAPYGSDYDPGSSYMSLLGTSMSNSQPPPWAVEEVTASTPINLTPQFSMVIYLFLASVDLLFIWCWALAHCKSMKCTEAGFVFSRKHSRDAVSWVFSPTCEICCSD
jgi:hypothetical protein